MAFNDDFRQLRKELDLEEDAYGKKFGISHTTVNQLERGVLSQSDCLLQSFKELKDSYKQNPLATEDTGLMPKTNNIIGDLETIIESARKQAYQNVNVLLIQRNWLLGKRIAEEELSENREDNYGKQIVISVAKNLTKTYGKGFDKASIYRFVLFYRTYKNIFSTVSGKSFLSWSHYLVLLQAFDDEARDWYEKEAKLESWSVRTLQRNVSTQCYYRMLKSQKKDLVRKEMLEKSPKENDERLEFVKNPAILEFLNLPEDNSYLEKGLEKAILGNLKDFMMELGRGYAFVASQKRIHTEKENYFIDLVFYNYILKSFVLVDLKMGKLSHQDIGQMDMYVKMFDEKEKGDNDNPTIGILLCSDTDADVARYSALNGNDHLFATKYKTCLPTEEELKREIENQKTMFYLQKWQERIKQSFALSIYKKKAQISEPLGVN